MIRFGLFGIMLTCEYPAGGPLKSCVRPETNVGSFAAYRMSIFSRSLKEAGADEFVLKPTNAHNGLKPALSTIKIYL